MATGNVTYKGGLGNPVTIPGVNFPVPVGATITVDADVARDLLTDPASWVAADPETAAYVPPTPATILGVVLQDGVVAIRDAGGTITTRSVALAQEESITLTSNRTAGTVSQLLRMVMSTVNDRPWISWIDHLGRHRCTLGYHDFDVTDGATHQRYEIKTSMDPAGGSPAGLRTRFALGTDSDRTDAILNGVTDLEINPGSFIDNTAFGIVLKERNRANSATVTLASFRALIDASDNTFIDLDAAVSVTNKNATLRFFRNLNTGSSTASIAVKKGDGTNTDTLTFNAKTGSLAIAGMVGFNGTAAPAKPSVAGSRAGNAALASLLTALASTGLLTDSSSA